MSDDQRRERYAAAMEECLTEGCDDPAQFANAAMAVADEEQRGWRTERAVMRDASLSYAAANARLRAELEAARRMKCIDCGASVGWVDCSTGGWWAHAIHPLDGHNALPRPDNPKET